LQSHELLVPFVLGVGQDRKVLVVAGWTAYAFRRTSSLPIHAERVLLSLGVVRFKPSSREQEAVKSLESVILQAAVTQARSLRIPELAGFDPEIIGLVLLRHWLKTSSVGALVSQD
jgi:hypothetical protein